jgi:drug/metabolite transporter (DMT)-like permease
MSRIAFLLLAVTLIAGVTPVAARMATAEIPPLLIPLARFGTAGLLLAVTAKWLGLWRAVPRRHWPMLAALGFLCVPVNQLGYLVGIKNANASHAGIAYALAPVLVFWISVALRQASPSRRLGIASLLAFVGAALADLATSGASQNVGEPPRSMVAGDALLLSAVLSWSLFAVFSQPLVKELGAVTTLCLVFLLGTLWHIPVALVDWFWFRSDFSITAITWEGWAGLAYLTFITAYLNYLLWYVVTARYDLTRSAVVTNAHFLVTVALEAVLFEQHVGSMAILGSALLLGGIVLATRTKQGGSG